jgi:hypothetical protein
MGSECETRLTFAARLPVGSAPVTIRQLQPKISAGQSLVVRKNFIQRFSVIVTLSFWLLCWTASASSSRISLISKTFAADDIFSRDIVQVLFLGNLLWSIAGTIGSRNNSPETGELPYVIQRASCSTICACDSQFKPGWMTDPGRGSPFWYENWAGLLRGLYARGCVFWKRVICGARSQASSAWVSSNPVCRTWDRTKNI